MLYQIVLVLDKSSNRLVSFSKICIGSIRVTIEKEEIVHQLHEDMGKENSSLEPSI